MILNLFAHQHDHCYVPVPVPVCLQLISSLMVRYLNLNGILLHSGNFQRPAQVR